MKMWKSWKALAVLAALALVAMTASRGYAQTYTPKATLNIDVQISASLSVTVDNVQSSTYSYFNWSQSNTDFVSTATAMVYNNSGGLDEKWSLSTFANSWDLGSGGDDWALVENTNSSATVHAKGNNHFALLALFSSSATIQGGCPLVGDAQWWKTFTQVGTGAKIYGDTATDGLWYVRDTDASAATNKSLPALPDVSAAANSYMSPYSAITANPSGHRGQRALCWKVIGPSGVNKGHPQEIQLMVTASAL